MKSLLRTLAAIGFACCGSLAQAGVLFTIDADTSSVSATIDAGGCASCINLSLASNLDGQHATLNVGESFTFDFFDISFQGIGGGTGNVSATLGLSSPVSGTVATGRGGFFTLFGVLNSGYLTWNDIAPTTVGSTTFQLSLENLSGFALGSTAVQGSIKLLSDGSSARAVSAPSTILLLGAGLIAIALVRRRRIA